MAGVFASPRSESIPFTKLSGAGNDFVVVDNRQGRVTDASSLARAVCTRGLSIGADGLILIETSPRATFRMRYLNADGSETEFCANGTRCAARFAFLNVIAPRRMTIETPAGVVPAEIHDARVRLTVPNPDAFRPVVELMLPGGVVVRGSHLIVGVPHYVVFLQGDLWSMAIDPPGRAIRHHEKLAPAGANATFVVVESASRLAVRTWERGVEAETLACGSGIVASVTTAAVAGRVESPVTVRTRSGIEVEVTFERTGETQRPLRNVVLTGDARVVFKGEIGPETVSGFDPEWVANPTTAAAEPYESL